jgi:alpha-galactosidase
MNPFRQDTLWCLLLMAAIALAGAAVNAFAASSQDWVDQVLEVPYDQPGPEPAPSPVLELLRQDYESLEVGRSVIQTPLVIGRRHFERGLGTHSVGHLRIRSPEPLARLSAWIGVDHNERTSGGRGSIVFVVSAGGSERYRSGVMRGGEEPEQIDVDLGGAAVVDLVIEDAGDGPACDHADWAEARLVTSAGNTLWLDAIPRRADSRLSRYPFSFLYDGRHSDELLPGWERSERSESIDGERTRKVTTWLDPETGLRVEWQAVRFADYPAVEWLLYFENTGTKDTPIIEDVASLDLALCSPLGDEAAYRLHRTNGAPSNPTDFEPRVVAMRPPSMEVLGGGGGRSSNKDFPFFKIESGEGSIIVAVGWSGQWFAQLAARDDRRLHVTAGLERTHFRLHPGERVRSPRMLLLHWPGDTLESNAQFRRLIYNHYTARRNGRRLLPTLYCNTCFTRGGGWLNECNAENQISLIRAYAPLGLEALLTDAGWFEGGWPAGAGNWTPRKDAYPQGMGPVAAAARSHGMVYGLWFEFERVVAGTWLHENRPEWLLSSSDQPQGTYLLNLGLPEVRDYLFGIVRGFMELPGFRVYRSDFNMNPLPYWRHTDAPDRQGITEMKYVGGLYEFWDRIARTWPDSLRIECASGGRRIDLETVMRMHVHQKSDYWFHNEVDQASIWGLSQYLPNNVFMAPLNRMDDNSFRSAMATSLCLGWIADAEDFDLARARQLVGQYREVRPLLVGGWYPVLPYTRAADQWIASQYDRPDLGRGMVLAFRHAESPEKTKVLQLHELRTDATYELHCQDSGAKLVAKGSELMAGIPVTISDAGQSELILYQKTGQ